MCNSNASLTLDLSIYFRLKLVLIKNNDPIYVFPLVIVYSRLYIHVIVGDDLPHLIDNLPRQIIIIFCHYFFSLFLYLYINPTLEFKLILGSGNFLLGIMILNMSLEGVFCELNDIRDSCFKYVISDQKSEQSLQDV